MASRFHRLGLVLESDSASVIKRIQEKEEDLAHTGNLINDVRSLIANFRNFELSCVSRSANNVAHILAHAAKDVSQTSWSYPPEFVLPTVLWDISS